MYVESFIYIIYFNVIYYEHLKKYAILSTYGSNSFTTIISARGPVKIYFKIKVHLYRVKNYVSQQL